MSNFKKGDRVRVVTNHRCGLPAGSVGTVVDDDPACPYVDWDGFTDGHSGPFHDSRRSCWAVPIHNLEAIDEE